MKTAVVTRLDPSRYVRTPWKNGGGVTTDIAFEGDTWRFSRTPITVAGRFSDYTGFDRMQVLVAGSGLVLQLNGGADLAFNSNGGFFFGTRLDNSAAYSVTVRTQPANPTQNCTVRNASGTIDKASITRKTTPLP